MKYCETCGQPITRVFQLRLLRLAKGKSLDAVARETKLSRQVLWELETGRGNPRWSTIRALAACYGVSVGEIADSLVSAAAPQAAEAGGE